MKKTQKEITLSDSVIIGDIYIGTGEMDAVRLLVKVVKDLQFLYPGIHYHISSGNADFVIEQLDKGLIDFGVILGDADLKKYNAVNYSDFIEVGASCFNHHCIGYEDT